MTLNCEVHLDQARKEFAATPSEETAAFYLEAALEFWRCDFITDGELAADLRAVARYLESMAAIPPA